MRIVQLVPVVDHSINRHSDRVLRKNLNIDHHLNALCIFLNEAHLLRRNPHRNCPQVDFLVRLDAGKHKENSYNVKLVSHLLSKDAEDETKGLFDASLKRKLPFL